MAIRRLTAEIARQKEAQPEVVVGDFKVDVIASFLMSPVIVRSFRVGDCKVTDGDGFA